ASAYAQQAHTPYLGVDMNGIITSSSQAKNFTSSSHLPVNYYDDSFRIISQGGMNHVRFIYFWESYEKNPSLFMSELNSVAQAADKWGIKVIYDNHQFHTSSWLDPPHGTGFPEALFSNNPAYIQHGGGAPKSK